MSREPVLVRIYSKPGCHLCDIAKDRVENVRRRVGFDLQVVDISTDPDLIEKYAQRIPVVTIGDEEAFAYRVSEKLLEKRLARCGVRHRGSGSAPPPSTDDAP